MLLACFKGTKRPRENQKDQVEGTSTDPETNKVPKKIVEKKNKGKEKVHENEENALVEEATKKKGKKKKIHDTMKLKTSPAKIVEIMQKLNEYQLASVKDMGFGELIHFGITEIPGNLAYKLLEGFRDVDCSIRLDNQRLPIIPEDVHVTLGLPIGGMLIRKSGRQCKQPFIDEVAQKIGKKRTKLLPDELITELFKDTSGGDWFKKMFVLCVDTIFINPCADGCCRTPIAYLYENIAAVKTYNWCAYLLDSLVEAQQLWIKTKTSPFTGPISFLVAFYVDRVYHRKLLVSRVFPTVSGWTSELLKERVKLELSTGEIGRGSVLERGDPARLPRPTHVVVMTGVEKPRENMGAVARAMISFADAGEEACNGIEKMLQRLNDVASLLKNLSSFRIAATTAYKMLDVVQDKDDDEDDPVAFLTTALAEDELDTPQILDTVESMVRVTAMLEKLRLEGPPFDIGYSFGKDNVS